MNDIDIMSLEEIEKLVTGQIEDMDFEQIKNLRKVFNDEASKRRKARSEFITTWEEAFGMILYFTKGPFGEEFILKSPTGFPLSTVRFDDRGRPTFGHPIGLQNDWLKEQKKGDYAEEGTDE